MRIAVNVRFLIKDKFEGVGWYTYEIISRIVRKHPEHEFLFIHDRPLAPEYIFADNVRSIKTWLPSRHPILWYFWFEHAIPRILAREKADLFLSFDGHLSVKTDVPSIYVLHDLAYLHYPNEIPNTVLQFYKKYIPQYVAKAAHIISVSEHGAQDLQQQFPKVQKQNISVVGNGCRQIFQALSSEDKKATRIKHSNGKPYLFFVGAVQPRKNIRRIIEAFDYVAKEFPDTQLLIAGRHAWKTDTIKEAYEASTYKDNIQFLGFVEDSELAKLMASTEALVYPSLFEGFGVPVLEAMHCDVPVISSKGSSMAEVVGEAGLLVDPTSVEQLGAAMRTVIADKNLAQQLIAKGQIQRQKFSWDIAADKMYTVIENMLSKI